MRCAARLGEACLLAILSKTARCTFQAMLADITQVTLTLTVASTPASAIACRFAVAQESTAVSDKSTSAYGARFPSHLCIIAIAECTVQTDSLSAARVLRDELPRPRCHVAAVAKNLAVESDEV